MSRESALGLFLIALFGLGIVLLARRPIATPANSLVPIHNKQGNISVIPVETGSPHYRNKETRLIEWNSDGLPTKIEIIRDYTIT